MLKIGCHLSAVKGYAAMGKLAANMGCNTLQCFARDPIGIYSNKISNKDSCEFKKVLRNNGFCKIVIHAPYILNPCAQDTELRILSSQMFTDDLLNMEEHFPNNFYNIHPGNFGNLSKEQAIRQAIDFFNKLISPHQTTTVLFETMCGNGTDIGKDFYELKEIIDGMVHKDKIGISMNISHIFSAGYDVAGDLDSVLDEFDKLIGLSKLYVIQLNDSSAQVYGRKSKYQKIGQGIMGLETISKIINHHALNNVLFLLDTPNDIDGYEKEIDLLKSMYIN